MKKNNLHKNKSGFKVPEGYFESFENKLSKKMFSETKEDSALSSNHDTGFEVPDNYFSSSKDIILNNVTTKKTKAKVISLFNKQNLIYFSGIAAIIAILITISIDERSELNFNDIEIADIHAYFIEGNVELSTTEIASLLGEEMNFIETFSEELTNEDALLDFLSEEDLEDAIIFEE